MNRFATETQANQDPTPLGPGDYYYIIPEGFTQGSGVFPFKAGTNPPRTFSQLPYAPNRGFAVITNTSSGSVSGPATSTVGNIAIWDDTTGTLLADGPAPSDFATATQGALANTAVQPGDPLTVLSSGAALNNYVPVADGAGNISWAPQSGGGSGDVTGPVSSVDNAISRFDGTTGKVIQNSTVTISDAGAMNGIALLNGNSLPLTPGTLITTAAITNMVEIGDPLTDLSSGAATAGQVPQADGAGNITWTTPVGGGDVVGPASSVDGNVPQFDGTTGKLLKDGLGTSEGGNGAADAGKLLKFDPRGGIAARTDDAFSVDPAGDFRSSGIAKSISAVSTGSGDGIYAQASSGIAIAAVTGDQTAIRGFNNSTTLPSLEVYNDDPTNVGPIAHFHDDAGDGMEVLNDGGLFWTSATGAQTTATNLPVFGPGTKGVVPAAGAVPSASNFLTETGVYAVPAGTGVTAVSVATANGFAGSSSGGATPALTISTTITGVLKGNGTAISAAVAGTDYLTPTGSGAGLSGIVLSVNGASGAVTQDQVTGLSSTGIIKRTAANTMAIAVAGTDFLDPAAIGVTVQAYDADLQAIAGLTSAANKGIQFTGAGAATTFNLDFGTEVAYSGTITWTASANPSGSSSLRQFYTRIGNMVTWAINLTYASAGTAVTGIVLTFPTEFPTPAIPSGFTGANARLYGTDPLRLLTSITASPTVNNGFMISRNAADNGFVITSGTTFASGNYNTFLFSGQYFCATA